MKNVLLIAVAALALAGAIAAGIYGWIIAGDVQMSAHGWFAMALGAVLSILVGGGLMALVFISARLGYDEAAHYDDSDLKL